MDPTSAPGAPSASKPAADMAQPAFGTDVSADTSATSSGSAAAAAAAVTAAPHPSTDSPDTPSSPDLSNTNRAPLPQQDICLHPEAERSTRDLVHPPSSAAPHEAPVPSPALGAPQVPPTVSAPPASQPNEVHPRTALASPNATPTTPTLSITPNSPEMATGSLGRSPPASDRTATPVTQTTQVTGASPNEVATPTPPNGSLSGSSGAISAASAAAELERERTREKRPKRILKGYVLGKTLGQGSMGKVKLATVAATNERVAIKMVPRHTTVGALYEQTRRRATSNGSAPPASGCGTESTVPHIGADGQEITSGPNPEEGPSSDWLTPPHSALVKAREKDAAKELRAVREGSLQLLLYHPYVCGVRELIVHAHFYYLVEEHVSGGQLLDYIIAHGRLREKVARKFARQLCSALRYLHANNVVHRDLKIENILLSDQGHVKLVDFGLANLWSPHRALRTFCGSLYFAAPELLRARPYVGPEVDVWSLGVVLFVLVAGRVPFDDPSIAVLHKLIQQGQVQYPSHLSSECRHALSRMLTVDPRKRATLSELSAHPWFTANGHEPELDTHIPRRMPLRPEELDKNVIRHMQGFAFGDADEIERKLIEILTSDMYLATLAGWDNQRGKSMGPDSLAIAPRDPPRPPPPRPVGSPQVGQSGIGQPPPVDDGELLPPDPATLDPTAGFHPMISVYYLVREKLEREEQQGGQPVFADAVLKIPSQGSSASSLSLSGPKPASSATELGSSMPTPDDIPTSPSMSKFSSNTLPDKATKDTSASSPSSGLQTGWGLPIPQRPPETMRWSRGLEMPGMASGLGDVGITIPPTPLRGLTLGGKRADDDPTSSPTGSTDTLTTPAPGTARASSISSRPRKERRGSEESIATETSLRPYSPASARVPVFDQDYRERSRPQGEMRGPPRSRDGGTTLEQTLLTSPAGGGIMMSASASSGTNGLPPHSDPSRSSLSSNPRISFSQWPPAASLSSPVDSSPSLGRSRSSASTAGQHNRVSTMGSWWSGGVGAPLSTVPSSQEDRSSAPSLDGLSSPTMLGIQPPRRAASMHNRSVSTTAPPRGSSHVMRQRAEAPPIVMRSSEEDLPTTHLTVPGQQANPPSTTASKTSTTEPTSAQTERFAPLRKLGAFMSRSIPNPFGDGTPTAEEKTPQAEDNVHPDPQDAVKDVSPAAHGAEAKPVFLRGLLSVSTTSTKSPAQLQAQLASALSRMNVQYTLIPGGFECRYQPSIAPAGAAQPAPSTTFKSPDETEGNFVGSITQAPTPRLSLSDPTSKGDGSTRSTVQGDEAKPDETKDGTGTGTGTESQSSVQTAASVQSAVNASALAELAVQLELCVVKVPFVGVSGVQVRRLAGDSWQYQVLAKRILEEAQI